MESLQALIDEARDGDTIKLIAGLEYDANTEVLVQNRHGLTIDGTGAYLKRTVAPPSGWQNQRQLQLIGCTNVTIVRLAVKGPKPNSQGYVPALESQHGIAVDSSLGVTLDHCTVQRVNGDGIYISGTCQHLTATFNVVHEAGRHGLTITSANGFTVAGNTLELCHRHPVDLEPGRSDEYVQNGVIAYNTFKDWTINPALNGLDNTNVLRNTITVGGNREIED